MINATLSFILQICLIGSSSLAMSMPNIFPNKDRQREETLIKIHDQLKQTIRSKIEKETWFQRNDVSAESKKFMKRVYTTNNFRAVWFKSETLRSSAQDLVTAIENLETHGLSIRGFRIPSMFNETAWAFPLDLDRWSDKTIEMMGELELVLTAEFLKAYSYLRYGRVNPRDVDSEWFLPRRPQVIDMQEEEWIELVINGDVRLYLEELSPQTKQYAGLREVLALYKRNLEKEPYKNFPKTLKLKLGDKDPKYVPLLRAKLEATMDARPRLNVAANTRGPNEEEQSLFDESLESAVGHFQARHGLKVTGELNSATLVELNTHLESRINQVRANLERWRWMPREMPTRFIMVNLAEYKLYFWDNDKLATSMNVVVGQEFRETPSFQSEIRTLETNPKWYVPNSIAVKDILPKLRKNPRELVKLGYRFYQGEEVEIDPRKVNWKKISPNTFKFHVVQDAGPMNALGHIKFWLPNSFGIYLHDTPAKELFDKRVRAFSSGCIRLEAPMTLAQHLLQGQPEGSFESLERAIALGHNTKMELKVYTPIYITYWTAWVSNDLTLNFRPDIYGRNEKLITLL